MGRGKDFLLTLTGTAMEMCWLSPWAAFSLNAVAGRPFPFLEALTAFIAGAWLTRLVTGRGWRVGAVLGLNLIGFAAAALLFVHGTHFSHHSLMDMGRLWELTGELHGFVEWAGFLAAAFWAFFFWIAGVAMARRPGTYYKFCARFDVGLAAYFSLFFLKMGLLVKGGVVIHNPVADLLIFPFFLFAILAIGISRLEDDGTRIRISSHGGALLIMGFILTVLLTVGCVTLFALSGLNTMARSAHGVIRSVAGSWVPIIERVLFMLFSRGNVRPEASSSSPRGDPWDMYGVVKGSWWMEWVERVLGYGLWSVLVLISVLMVTGALVLLVRWLFSKTSGNPHGSKRSWVIPHWFAMVRIGFARLGRVIARFVKGYGNAREAYASLVQWARRTGCPLLAGETPQELGARLCARFPSLEREIDGIVYAYNREVYGSLEPGRDGLRSITAACRSLGNPLYWPSRVRVWATGARQETWEGNGT